MTQPVARREVVRDTYFGTTIEDPYRWMEDWKGEELQAWIKAQADHTRSFLDALPEREALLQRITELGNASPLITSIQIEGGRYFYLRRDPSENLPKLIVRFASGQQEKVLLDPNTLGGEVHTALDWYTPSRDGQRVAYGISQGGSEESTLHVLEVESGQTLDVAIEHTPFGGVAWLAENASFVYNRFPERGPSAPETDRYFDSCMYLHHMGSDPKGTKDIAVFGQGVNPRAEIARSDHPFLRVPATSTWMLGVIQHGDLNELSIYAAPQTTLTDPKHCPWTKIVDVEDEVTGYEIFGDTLYLKSHKNAPRYKVLTTSLKHPDLSQATVVVPESKVVVEDLLVAGDALLIKDLDGGIGRIRHLNRKSGKLENVPLPFEGTIQEWANEDAGPEVLVKMASWTVSPRIYLYNTYRGSANDTGLLPVSPVDFSEIEAHEVHAPAKDGTLIPLSIIYKKGLKLDGSNPTLLQGYGSYGITLNAQFTPPLLAWYERGGVLAVAHIRGGGEYGDEWHKAGQKLNKGNTIDDFIACAEYLIQQGYTRPERLAGQGGSAGGIPSGGSLVKRPDLWAAVIMHVAVTNTLRSELTENGPPNIPEFGSVTTEEGFQGLLITDSYTRVKDGVKYPAVIVTTGLNDPRVVVWMATKMAARLQAATTSGKPVLLRVEYQAGHGMGSTKQQYDKELADRLAFLLEQMKAS